MAMDIVDARTGVVRATVASDGTVSARGTVIGYINPDGSAGDAYHPLPLPLSESINQLIN